MPPFQHNGSVAQLAEQGTLNAEVEGSSPSGVNKSTNRFKIFLKRFFLCLNTFL